MSSLKAHLRRIARIGRGASKRRGDSAHYKAMAVLAVEARRRSAEQKRIAVISGS